jgi:gliding motility-associated-like protein
VASGTNEISFSDANALSKEQSYTYKYILYNKCNEIAGESNPARTLLLQGIADDGFVNKLFWNTYEEWDGQVFEYKVFRSLGNSAIFEEVFNAVTDTIFIDRVADEVDRELTFCYLVKAFEGPGNSFGRRDSSYSNVLCITQKPTIYFPSAFAPGQPGENAQYKPKGLYETLAKNFRFAIYNRWGEEVFYTEDTMKGWDGTYQSQAVAPDIFAVRITFDLPDGTEFKHTGSVLVLY